MVPSDKLEKTDLRIGPRTEPRAGQGLGDGQGETSRGAGAGTVCAVGEAPECEVSSPHSSQQPCLVGAIIIPTLHMRTLKHREVK